jgi:hypothetical protein
MVIEWRNSYPPLTDFENDPQLPPDAEQLTGPEWLIVPMP